MGDRQAGNSEELGESSSLPSFRSQPSRLGLKKVCVRSFPSSSGMENGSFFMLSNRFCPRALMGERKKERKKENPCSNVWERVSSKWSEKERWSDAYLP